MWIDFEGIDGCGKTTISVRVAARLREAGRAVFHPRETGSYRSRVVSSLREVTRDPENALLSPEAELLVNAAREGQLLAEEIRPALQRGEIVVTDRGLHAHEAIATAVRGLAPQGVRNILRFAADGLWPDVVVYVDVDPDVARMRKRLRRIRERRLSPSGRKGQMGQSYPHRIRAAFLARVAEDPRRWLLLDNSWRSPEEAVQEAVALLAPILRLDPVPRPPPPERREVRRAESLEAWAAHFFEFVGALSHRDALSACLHVSGIDHPSADQVRLRAADAALDVTLVSVSGMDTPLAWQFRREGLETSPFSVARSLKGLATPESWEFRRRLARTVPEAVAMSLGGLDQDEAYDLREELESLAPDEVVRSLAGLDDPRAWSLRRRAKGEVSGSARVESVEGLEGDEAWVLRAEMRARYPVSVLRSLRRIDDGRAWMLRNDFSRQAPGVVLESVRGMDGREAEEIRDRLQSGHPEEVALSLSGLDHPEAWRRRHDLLDAAPTGVLGSLMSLAGDPLARALVENALGRSGGRPRLVRRAVQFLLRCRPLQPA